MIHKAYKTTKRQEDVRVKLLASAVFDKDRPSKSEIKSARRLYRMYFWLKQHNVTRAVLRYEQLLKITRDNFTPENKGEIKAGMNTLKPAIRKLLYACAKLPSDLAFALAHVNQLAVEHHIDERPPTTLKEARKYVQPFSEFIGVYVTLGTLEFVIQAAINNKRAVGKGFNDGADALEKGFARQLPPPSADQISTVEVSQSKQLAESIGGVVAKDTVEEKAA